MSFGSVLASMTLGLVVLRQTYAPSEHATPAAIAIDALELLALLGLAVVLVGQSLDGPRRRARIACSVAALGVGLGLARALNGNALAAGFVMTAGLLVAGAGLVWALPRAERGWLVAVALVALVPRLVAALALHAYGLSVSPRAIALDDESSYDFAARELVASLNGIGALASEWWHLEGHHLSFLGALYALIGAEPLLARIACAFLGAGAAVLAALTARALFGHTAGLVAGLVFGLVPSLVVWSATLLKEPLVSALIVLVFWGAARWRSAPSWQLVVLIAASLQTLTSVRLYAGLGLTLVVLLALGVSVLSRVRPGRGPSRQAAVLATGVLGAGVLIVALLPLLSPVRLVYYQTVIRLVPPPAELLPEDFPPQDRIGGVVGGEIVIVNDEARATQTPGMIIGRRGADQLYVALSREQVTLADRAAVQPLASMRSDEALRHLLQALGGDLVAALVAPLHQPATSPLYLLLAADTLMWLAFAVLAVAGAVRTREQYLLLPLAFTALMLAVQAITGGNAGNLVRQRAVLGLPGLIIASTPMLVVLLGWLSARLRWPLHPTPQARGPAPGAAIR